MLSDGLRGHFSSLSRSASGRPEALERIYRSASATELPALLDAWQIDYVYVGPSERSQYEITPRSEERLAEAMELVFESGDVRIYRRIQ